MTISNDVPNAYGLGAVFNQGHLPPSEDGGFVARDFMAALG